jgi:hypothetical protein
MPSLRASPTRWADMGALREWWQRLMEGRPDHEDGTSHTWEHCKFDLWRCPTCGLMDGYDPLLDGPR